MELKRYVNHNGTMRKHPSGTYYKVMDVNSVIVKHVKELEITEKYTLSLERKIREMEATLVNTTGIIDSLQKQLKINKALRSDAQM